MNEKHRKKKLVSHNEINCTEDSVQILKMCIGLFLLVLNLSGPLQFWWIPFNYPLRLRRRRQRRWRRRWSLHDTKGHCPRRWRGKNCSMIDLFAKRHPLHKRKDTKISLPARYKIQLSSPIFFLEWDVRIGCQWNCGRNPILHWLVITAFSISRNSVEKKRISRNVLFLFSEHFVLENWIFRDSVISFNIFGQTGFITMEFMSYFLKLLCKQDLS